jgi:hypothetical protein
LLLSESQLAALEKATADKEAYGEFENECPGYSGAQDTFYVGTLEGVGPHLSADFFAGLKYRQHVCPLRLVMGCGCGMDSPADWYNI